MKVILNTEVINLGEEGDICDVAVGYARNYLFPRKLAVPYNKQYLRQLEHKREAIDVRKEEKRTAALGLKEKLESEELVFRMSASKSGKLFGSVSVPMIAEELEKRGYEIERKRIEVPYDHVRMTGEYQVKVKLYGQEEAQIKIIVEPAEE